jgi:hypothetical protein
MSLLSSTPKNFFSARQGSLKMNTWQYAFAGYNFLDLRASYDGREVWHVEAMPEDSSSLDIGTSEYQDSVYTTYHTATTPIDEQ